MDLKNYEITIGEVLQNPKARALMEKELPQFMNHPLLPFLKNTTLREAVNHSPGRVPPEKVKELLLRLKRL